MPSVLEDFSAPALIQANEANQQSIFSLLSRLPGAEISDSPEMLRICTGAPFFLLNGVLRSALPETDLDARIATTLAYFRARGVPMMWFVTTSTRPTDLGARLQAHGLALLTSMPGMAVDLPALPPAPPLPAGVTIVEAHNAATLADWSQAAGIGFGMPTEVIQVFADVASIIGYGEASPLRCFVAYRNGEPVGTSSLYLDGSVAGIYTVAVVPEARQQGLGAALTVTPLEAARAQGYRIGILQASAMGAPVYRRLGFQEYGQFTLYGRTEAGEPA